MHASFQYPSFTYEVQYAPYHLYQFIMEYESFDGNVEQLMAMPEMAGVDLQQLEQYYNSMLSSASVSESESDTEAQAEQILKEIIDMGVRVSEISKMTAEEYQALSDDDRVNDSTYMFTLQYVGLQPADLQQYDEFKSFDFARSQRLWEEYVSNHPELKEALDGML